jgi:hypothetical protein
MMRMYMDLLIYMDMRHVAETGPPPPLHSLCVIRIASQASSPFTLATRLASCAKIPIDSLLNPLLLFLA